jgi:hypothetical protein
MPTYISDTIIDEDNQLVIEIVRDIDTNAIVGKNERGIVNEDQIAGVEDGS